MFFGCLPCCGGGCKTHLAMWPDKPELEVVYDYRFRSSSYEVYELGSRLTQTGNEQFVGLANSVDTSVVSTSTFSATPNYFADGQGFDASALVSADINTYNAGLTVPMDFGGPAPGITDGSLLPNMRVFILEAACARMSSKIGTISSTASTTADSTSNGLSLYIHTAETYSDVKFTLNDGFTTLTGLPSGGQSYPSPRPWFNSPAGLFRVAVNEPFAEGPSTGWYFSSTGTWNPGNFGSLLTPTNTRAMSSGATHATWDTISITLDVWVKSIALRSTGENVSLSSFPLPSYSVFPW